MCAKNKQTQPLRLLCVPINRWLHGELRGACPFLDKEFMDVAMRLNPKDKMAGNGTNGKMGVA
jgi:hypothetical protein